MDQPHAAALSSNAVLYLLLLCLRDQRLQLHLQRGHGQWLVLLREEEELLWVLAHAPVAPYIPPVCASEPATLIVGYVIAAHERPAGKRLLQPDRESLGGVSQEGWAVMPRSHPTGTGGRYVPALPRHRGGDSSSSRQLFPMPRVGPRAQHPTVHPTHVG